MWAGVWWQVCEGGGVSTDMKVQTEHMVLSLHVLHLLTLLAHALT